MPPLSATGFSAGQIFCHSVLLHSILNNWQWQQLLAVAAYSLCDFAAYIEQEPHGSVVCTFACCLMCSWPFHDCVGMFLLPFTLLSALLVPIMN